MIIWIHSNECHELFLTAVRDTAARSEATATALLTSKNRSGRRIDWILTGTWYPRPFNLERIP